MYAGTCDVRMVRLSSAMMNADRYIWWNFVASSKDRIEAAKRLGALEIGRMAAFICPLAMMPNLFRALIVKGA